MTDGEPTGYTCDKCGLPILREQAVHGLYHKEEAKTGRHWDCSATAQLPKLRAELDEKLARLRGLTQKLRERR